MAFNKKTWKDRVSEQPQRRLLTPTDGGEAMTVDVTRQEGIVIQEGDAFSAANMNDLETRIKNTFDSDESTLNAVNTKANTNANNITSLQTNLTSVSNRVTTNTNNINANKTTETNHYNSLATRATNLETRAGTLENELTANSKRIYMDYKNGKYGINTSANRGADTFIPFRSGDGITQLVCSMGSNTNGGYTGCEATLNTERSSSLKYTDIYINRSKGSGYAEVTLRIYGDGTLIHTKTFRSEGGTTAGTTLNISNYSNVRLEMSCYKESSDPSSQHQLYVRGITVD